MTAEAYRTAAVVQVKVCAALLLAAALAFGGPATAKDQFGVDPSTAHRFIALFTTLSVREGLHFQKPPPALHEAELIVVQPPEQAPNGTVRASLAGPGDDVHLTFFFSDTTPALAMTLFLDDPVSAKGMIEQALSEALQKPFRFTRRPEEDASITADLRSVAVSKGQAVASGRAMDFTLVLFETEQGGGLKGATLTAAVEGPASDAAPPFELIPGRAGGLTRLQTRAVLNRFMDVVAAGGPHFIRSRPSLMSEGWAPFGESVVGFANGRAEIEFPDPSDSPEAHVILRMDLAEEVEIVALLGDVWRSRAGAKPLTGPGLEAWERPILGEIGGVRVGFWVSPARTGGEVSVTIAGFADPAP
ncbi:MAG: hypothetical protein AAF909_04350 [Pseudomonadota bacterium]